MGTAAREAFSRVDYKQQQKWQRLINDNNLKHRFSSQWMCNRTPLKTKNSTGYGYVDVALTHTVRGHEVKTKASFHSLSHCHSAWSCPYCTPRRLAEFAFKTSCIIDHKYKHGYEAYMLTYTVPHHHQPLAELMNQLKVLRHKVPNTAGGQDLHRLGWGGSIISLEITYSLYNGWHPHLHQLIFIKKGAQDKLKAAIDRYRRFYVETYYREFGVPDYEYCVDLFEKTQSVYLSVDQNGEPRRIESGDYICGWGGDNEIAKMSNGKKKSAQVFDLLESDDPHDNALFMEYAWVVKGRGRVWFSHGIQQGVDFENAAIAKAQKKTCTVIEAEVVASLPLSSWYEILDNEQTTGKVHRQGILNAAELNGYEGVLLYCLRWCLPLPLLPQRQLRARDGTEALANVYCARKIARTKEYEHRKRRMKRALARIRPDLQMAVS